MKRINKPPVSEGVVPNFAEEAVKNKSLKYISAGEIPNFSAVNIYRTQKSKNKFDNYGFAGAIKKYKQPLASAKTPEDVANVVERLAIDHSLSGRRGISTSKEFTNATSLSTSEFIGKRMGQKGDHVLSSSVPSQKLFSREKIIRFLKKDYDSVKDIYPKVEQLKKDANSGALEKWVGENGLLFNAGGQFNTGVKQGKNIPSVINYNPAKGGSSIDPVTGKVKTRSIEQEIFGWLPKDQRVDTVKQIPFAAGVSPAMNRIDDLKSTKGYYNGEIPNFARMDFHQLYMQEQAKKQAAREAKKQAVKQKNVERAQKSIEKYPEMKLTGDFDNQLPIIQITDPATGTLTKFSYGKNPGDDYSRSNIIRSDRAEGVDVNDPSAKGGSNRNFDILTKFTKSQRGKDKQIDSSFDQVRVGKGKTPWEQVLDSYPQLKQRIKEGLKTSGTFQIGTDIIEFSSLRSLKTQVNKWVKNNGQKSFDDWREANLGLNDRNMILSGTSSGEYFAISDVSTKVLDKKDKAYYADSKVGFAGEGVIPNFISLRPPFNNFKKPSMPSAPLGSSERMPALLGNKFSDNKFINDLLVKASKGKLSENQVTSAVEKYAYTINPKTDPERWLKASKEIGFTKKDPKTGKIIPAGDPGDLMGILIEDMMYNERLYAKIRENDYLRNKSKYDDAYKQVDDLNEKFGLSQGAIPNFAGAKIAVNNLTKRSTSETSKLASAQSRKESLEQYFEKEFVGKRFNDLNKIESSVFQTSAASGRLGTFSQQERTSFINSAFSAVAKTFKTSPSNRYGKIREGAKGVEQSEIKNEIWNPVVTKENIQAVKKENPAVWSSLTEKWNKSQSSVPQFVSGQVPEASPSPPVLSKGISNISSKVDNNIYNAARGYIPNFNIESSKEKESSIASELYNKNVKVSDTKSEKLEIGGTKETVVVNNREQVFNTGKDVQKAFDLPSAPDGGMVLPPADTQVGRQRRKEFKSKAAELLAQRSPVSPTLIARGFVPNFQKQKGGRKKNEPYQDDPNNVIDLKPFTTTDFTMLLPHKRGGSGFGSTTRTSGPYAKKYQTMFNVGWNIKGLHPEMGKNAEEVGMVAEKTYTSVKDTIFKHAQNFVAGFGEPEVRLQSPEVISSQIEKNINLGSLQGIAGNAFEAAANVAFKNVPVNTGGGDFDVRGPRESLRQVFQWPVGHGFIGDYKAGSGGDTKTSMADKILKELDSGGLLSGQVDEKREKEYSKEEAQKNKEKTTARFRGLGAKSSIKGARVRNKDGSYSNERIDLGGATRMSGADREAYYRANRIDEQFNFLGRVPNFVIGRKMNSMKDLLPKLKFQQVTKQKKKYDFHKGDLESQPPMSYTVSRKRTANYNKHRWRS